MFKKIYIKPTDNDPWLSLANFDAENDKLLPSTFDISDILSPKIKITATDHSRRYLAVLNSLRHFFRLSRLIFQRKEKELWTLLFCFNIDAKSR